MKWYDEIPYLGWHPDNTLKLHTGRDAVFALLASLAMWPFVLYLQTQLAGSALSFDYPLHWAGGALFAFAFSCGFEASERPPPRFFGIGDFAVSILGSQILFNVAVGLSGEFSWIIFGAVLGCQVFIYLIVIGGLYVANKLLKRDVITP